MMSIGIRFRQGLLALALVLVLGLPVQARLVLRNVYTYEGILGAINTPQITVVNEKSGVVPILLPQGVKLPEQYQVGQRVWVELQRGTHGMWVLRKIRRLDVPGQPSIL